MKKIIITFCFFILTGIACLAQQGKATFTNPLLPSGADPWVIYKNGYYYYTNSMGSRLVIWKTKRITNLDKAERKTIWVPPAGMPYSKEIWAPELHFLRGRWYMYFAADDGSNNHHRMYVLENPSARSYERRMGI